MYECVALQKGFSSTAHSTPCFALESTTCPWVLMYGTLRAYMKKAFTMNQVVTPYLNTRALRFAGCLGQAAVMFCSNLQQHNTR